MEKQLLIRHLDDHDPDVSPDYAMKRALLAVAEFTNDQDIIKSVNNLIEYYDF